MRKFPRAARTQVRLGNVLPDVAGEIDTRHASVRVKTENGVGVAAAVDAR